MKTKEFIKCVEDMGFNISNVEGNLRITDDTTLAWVNRFLEFSIDTEWSDFDYLSEKTKRELFILIVEYASTPLDDREEPKKYLFRIKYTGKYYDYLNYDSCDEKWYFADKGIGLYNKNEFTLEELPVWIHEMLEQGHLVKEEVE